MQPAAAQRRHPADRTRLCLRQPGLPGPSNLFLLAHGIGHGRAAVAAMTGIETASAIRILLAAAGLSAVLASSAVTFTLIRWAGSPTWPTSASTPSAPGGQKHRLARRSCPSHWRARPAKA
jgi:hypothetical protein